MDEFCNIERLTQYLGCSRRFVYNLHGEGKLTFYKLGGKVYVAWQEINDLIRKGRIE